MGRGSLHVHEVFVSVRPGAVMETMTAGTGQMKPTAQVKTGLLIAAEQTSEKSH